MSEQTTAAAPVKIKLKKKDLESDQEVRWCPGCGDYAILANVQRTMAALGVDRAKTVFISGIGCSSRFPYYMNTYGFHTIHGRAPAIATGLKLANPELSVWVVTGDGDGLSIGGNHLIHALRRNIGLNILLFNNRIYGLTKGQYSPTSEQNTRSPSTPMGSLDYALNPAHVALGANATFVARVADTDAKLLGEGLRRAMEHEGTSFVELLQNCPVFNDGVWAEVTDKKQKADRQLAVENGKPLLFGKEANLGIRMMGCYSPGIVEVGDEEGQTPLSEVVVHDESAPMAYATMLGSMRHPQFPLPVGVLRAIERPSYERMVDEQIQEAIATRGQGDLRQLLHSGMTWEVGPDGVAE